MELSALRIDLLPIWIHIAALFSSRRLESNDWRKGLIDIIIELVGRKLYLQGVIHRILNAISFGLHYFDFLVKLDRYIAV